MNWIGYWNWSKHEDLLGSHRYDFANKGLTLFKESWTLVLKGICTNLNSSVYISTYVFVSAYIRNLQCQTLSRDSTEYRFAHLLKSNYSIA